MIWYKNPKNYARRIYKRRKTGEKPMASVTQIEEGVMIDPSLMLTEAINAKCDGNLETYKELIEKVDIMYKEGEVWCQIVPLKDAMEIVDIGTPLGKMACICRRWARGIEEDSKTFSCMGIGTGMLKWERWPDRYHGGVEFLSPDEAKEWLKYWDKRGLVHTVMNYERRIGGLCNCDYPGCAVIRHRLDYDIKYALLKSHYVAKVDYDLCNGCGKCIQRCQFKAMALEVSTRKANIDMTRCFGCGLCETGCPMGAINLIERETVPTLKEVW